ncbi:MAG: hypothetical protein M3021_06755 [Actinomycetota bacterium]|nr:hypothetical protein [Actinomycetota bacterium]
MAAGDDDGAVQYGTVGAEHPVCEPAAGDGEQVEQGSIGGDDGGCGGLVKAKAAVRHRVGEEQDKNGLESEVREPLPHLQAEECCQPHRLTEKPGVTPDFFVGAS